MQAKKEKDNAPSKSKKSQFIAPIRFLNSLPNVPFDPKFLKYPFEKNQFVKYAITSFEQNYKYQLHTEPDMGIEINLIDPSAYQTPTEVIPLDEEDALLLNPPAEVEGKPAENGHKKRRIENLRPAVPWLQRTTYISSYSEPLKRTSIEEPRRKKVETDKETQRRETIKGIEATFTAVEETPIPVHPKKPGMKAVEILPVFPNFDLWPNMYNQVIFDRDPSLKTKEDLSEEEQAHLKNNALIKGFEMRDKKFVAYLVPKKRSRDDMEEEEEGEEFSWVREYHFEVRKGGDFRDAFVLAFDENNVTYNLISTRVLLHRLKTGVGRRLATDQKELERNDFDKPSKIIAKHRDLTEEEVEEMKEAREEILRLPGIVDAFDVQEDD